MKSKKLFCLLLLSSLLLFCMTACGDKEKENNPNYDSDNYLSGYHYAQMDIEDYGSMIIALDANLAPATVTNFVNLVNEGFYDGLTFHRIIDGYLMQGGDPKGDGTGSSTYTVPGEFSSNGYNNPISHVRGTISMARTKDYDSASAQFFIVQQDTTALDGDYAAFGSVISGIEIVDAICSTVPAEDEDGTVLPKNQPVISFITMLAQDYLEEMTPEEILPSPTGEINFSTVTSLEGLELEASLTINQEGPIYLISSTVDLLNISLYEVDLSNGLNLEESSLLTSCGDIGANELVSLQITVPENELSLLLVAEEHNGALAQFFLCYDSSNDNAYLVPIAR